MSAHQLRVVVVGASSLLGKELSEEISGSALGTAEILLFDAEAVEGQVTTVGDEASFIRRVGPGSFEGADFAFFAGSAEQTRENWQRARRAGAMVVDLTYALAKEPEVMVWSPWVAPLHGVAGGGKAQSGVAARLPDLQTAAVVPPHPVATMLALLATRLSSATGEMAAAGALRTMAATMLQPASEFGTPGLDELHQQTVSLLSFKDLPQEVFDGQTAFNVLADLGEEAAVRLPALVGMMEAQYEALSNGQLPKLALQLLQAPVFHGYSGSIFLEFAGQMSAGTVRKALGGGRVEVLEGTELPSNLAAAGRSELLVSVTAADAGEMSSRFWVCLAADNLKMAAVNAIDCALGMRSLRPQGKVQ